jgi:hypothetical protein
MAASTSGSYRLTESSSPPSAFMGGRVSGSGLRHFIRPELWPIDGGPRAGWLMTTREIPPDDAVTLEVTAEFVEGLETTTWPLGMSQIEPTWVVTVEVVGGQPGIAGVVP